MGSSVGHTPFGFEPSPPNLRIRVVYASRPLSIMLFPREPSEPSGMPENNPPVFPLSIFPLFSRHTYRHVRFSRLRCTHVIIGLGRTRFGHHLADTVNNRAFFPLFYLIPITRGRRTTGLYHFNGRSWGTTPRDFPIDRRPFVNVFYFSESRVFVIEPRKSLERNY